MQLIIAKMRQMFLTSTWYKLFPPIARWRHPRNEFVVCTSIHVPYVPCEYKHHEYLYRHDH